MLLRVWFRVCGGVDGAEFLEEAFGGAHGAEFFDRPFRSEGAEFRIFDDLGDHDGCRCLRVDPGEGKGGGL
jgi:hypothetical protein